MEQSPNAHGVTSRPTTGIGRNDAKRVYAEHHLRAGSACAGAFGVDHDPGELLSFDKHRETERFDYGTLMGHKSSLERCSVYHLHPQV